MELRAEGLCVSLTTSVLYLEAQQMFLEGILFLFGFVLSQKKTKHQIVMKDLNVQRKRS